ncbi:MAG: radical SAM protein [Dinghuibacter sp.]|nr:radical SAM protein [Dinghuibacter sp.]
MKKVTSYVLKVASRCNLNCSYCYMYNLGDKTYMNQPKFMSLETITALAEKLEAYSVASGIPYMQIIFHGGEPLLLGPDYYAQCLAIFKEKAPSVDFSFSIQTNGVSLGKEWYEWLQANGVRVGISIDGPERFHDAYRKFHNGRGSYHEVAEAVKLGAQNGLVGILSVLNIDIPVEEYYREMKTLEVKNLNLLFPDGHYDRLPHWFDKERFGADDYTPFADWLIGLFDLWKKDKERPIIKLFENILEILFGDEQVGNQAFGLSTNGVAVIETDGGIEVADSIRACYENITRNTINVHTHRVEDIFNNPLFEVYYHAHTLVAKKCLNCPVYDFCGGGFLGNRYAYHNGFDNPTIYCKDIIKLVTHIQNDFINELPAETVARLELEKVTYGEILETINRPDGETAQQDWAAQLLSFKQPDLICS